MRDRLKQILVEKSVITGKVIEGNPPPGPEGIYLS
jgi:hypothetical protein